jgi:hypothetical protein
MLFTCLTANASPLGQSLTSNNFDTMIPEFRRLVTLGYL